MADKRIIETMEFDNYAYAKDVLELYTAKLEEIKDARKIAGAATVCSLLSLVFSSIVSLNTLFFLLALVGSIVAYKRGGGIRIAFSVAKKLAFIGWVIIPFPWDLLSGLMTLLLSFAAFLFVPIVFVQINYWQYKQYCKDAETYLQYCKQTATTVEE